MKPTRGSVKPIQLGQGAYELSYLNLENGQTIARGLLDSQRQAELLSRPKGRPNYMAKALLSAANCQLEDHFSELGAFKQKLKKLVIPAEDTYRAPRVMYEGKGYRAIDMDRFSVELAGSEEYPEAFFWIALENAYGQVVAQIVFHHREVSIFSTESLMVYGQDEEMRSLSINTAHDLICHRPLLVKGPVTVSSRNVIIASTFESEDLHFLCLEQCTTRLDAVVKTKGCIIKAGVINLDGYVETKAVSLLAELTHVQGMLVAKAKDGISIIGLGIHAQEDSHLHGSKINLLVGSPEKPGPTADPLFGKLNLSGTITSRGLHCFAPHLFFAKGKTWVQGNVTLFSEYKTEKAACAQWCFNGKLFRNHSEFASWIQGAVIQEPSLEVYLNHIIVPNAHLPISQEEQLRSKIAKVLVHTAPQEESTRKSLVFLPALPEQRGYLHQPYDKSQFTAFEGDEVSEASVRILFSANEYLRLSGDFSVDSAQVEFEAKTLELSAQLHRSSFFGAVTVLVKSLDLDLRGARIDTKQTGHFLAEVKNHSQVEASFVDAEQVVFHTGSLTISPLDYTTKSASDKPNTSQFIAERSISIKSESDSRIEKKAKLILRSRQLTTWECGNFYLRGSLDFEELSIKAKGVVSLMMADMRGQKLSLDARCFKAFLTSLHVKTISVKALVSLIALCDISSDLYSNTSIANFSCAFYRPATLSLNGKSLISCSLAATNTLISILQLVIHDPSSQLAFTLARIGINAGPALYQAYKLTEALHTAANQKKALERGELITLLNQSKVLLLSMGSLVYSGVGVVNQCMHFDPKQGLTPEMHSWTEVVRDVNNVATPLLGLVLPGKHTSNIIDLDMDLNLLPFGAITNFSILRMRAGWDASLITSDTSLGLLSPNPYSFDVSPLMSTNTNLYSVSCAPETISPVSVHSERSMDKTFVSTGLPNLAHNASLTTHALRVIGQGSQFFSESTLQTDSFEVEQNTTVNFNESTLNVLETATNAGEVFVGNSQVTAHQWNNTKEATLIALGSALHLTGFSEQGRAHLVASDLSSQNWQELGTIAADASHITGKCAYFDKTAQAGFRDTGVDIEHADNKIKIGVDLDGTYYGPDHRLHPSSTHCNKPGHQQKESRPTDVFNYRDETKPAVSITPSGEILYQLNYPLILDGTQVSVLPLAVKAPHIQVSHPEFTSPIALYGDVSLNHHSHLSAAGNVIINGKAVDVRGGAIESGGTLTIKGEQTSLEDGVKLLANGDIQVSSKGEFNSTGRGKTTTSTETNKKWLGLVKNVNETTQTTFIPNRISSVNGNVDLESDKAMNLKGTVVSGDSVQFSSGDKMTLSPLIGTDGTVKNHTTILAKDTYEQGTETASSTCVIAKKTITFKAAGDFENIGSDLSAPEKIQMIVPDTAKVVNTGLVLNSYYKESHLGLYFKPIIPVTLNQYTSQLPLVDSLGALAKNHDLSSAIKVSVDLANTSQSVLTSLANSSIDSSLLGAFLPKLGLNLKLTRSLLRIQNQHLGSGSISTGCFEIQGGEALFIDAPKVTAQTTHFKVHSLQVIGAALNQSIQLQENALEGSISAWSLTSGITSLGLAHSDYHSNQRIWQGQVDFGDFNLQADKVLIYGSQMAIKSIKGHVNEWKGYVLENLESHSGHQMRLNTDGSFSYAEQSGYTPTAAFGELLKPESSQTSFDASEFSVNSLYSEGLQMDEIKAEHVHYQALLETKKEQDFSISGSLLGSTNNSTVCSTWEAHISHQDKTTSDDRIVADKHWHYGAVLPMYNPQAGSHLAASIRSLSGAWQPEQPTVPEAKDLIPQVVPNKTQIKKESPTVHTEEISPLPQHEESSDHEGKFFTYLSNFGVVAEVAAEDMEYIEGWNHSLQKLLKSPEMDVYLDEAHFYLRAEAAFNDSIESVFKPFTEMLHENSSYLYPMYADSKGSHFFTREVLEQPDVPRMIEKIGQNIDKKVTYYAKVAGPLHFVYLSSVVLEGTYQLAHGKLPLPLIREEAYATVGAVGSAAFASELTPYFKSATQLLSKSAFIEKSPYVLKALDYSSKFTFPLVGMVAGGLIGTYFAEENQNNDMDIALSSGMARELWNAGHLREVIGAEFKEVIAPRYTASNLSHHSIAKYYLAMEKLEQESTLIGRALAKPLMPEVMEFTQIADKFAPEMIRIKGTIIKDVEFAAEGFCIENEIKPVYNVNGNFFRELIEKHSDFADHTINKLKFMAKSLALVSAAESLYQVFKAEDKVDEVTRMALSYGAAEGGASLGIAAGSTLCAMNPLCLAGAGIAGGVAAVFLTQKGWEQMIEDSQANTQDGVLSQLPSLRTTAAFFKPSEYLGSVDISDRQSTRVYQLPQVSVVLDL